MAFDEDTGIIRVDVLEAHNLRAADRNGKSDPYCEFYLNGEKVFTTQIQKKTLNPKWNEVSLNHHKLNSLVLICGLMTINAAL